MIKIVAVIVLLCTSTILNHALPAKENEDTINASLTTEGSSTPTVVCNTTSLNETESNTQIPETSSSINPETSTKTIRQIRETEINKQFVDKILDSIPASTTEDYQRMPPDPTSPKSITSLPKSEISVSSTEVPGDVYHAHLHNPIKRDVNDTNPSVIPMEQKSSTPQIQETTEGNGATTTNKVHTRSCRCCGQIIKVDFY